MDQPEQTGGEEAIQGDSEPAPIGSSEVGFPPA
jgi:hypothetical protein